MRKRFIESKQEMEKILAQKSVQTFFQKIYDVRKGSGNHVEAPEDIYTIIMDTVESYSKLYPLVEYFFPIGNVPGKIIIGKDVTAAEFKPDNVALSAENFAINVEFEYGNGFKVAKVIFISNNMIDAQPDQYEAYIVKELARAIALALDDAILNGQGKDSYQLEGIIKNLPEQNIIGITLTELNDILEPINLVDSGEYNDNEIVAIVNRNTYYKKLLKHLISCSNPGALPKFTFCYAMPEDKILYADLSKYILIQRGGFTLESSKHVRFIGDETGYKGKMYFEGKPGRSEAFALVNLQ